MGKSHNLIGQGIFHGDQKSRDLHEKSRDLSNYEIFQHKILKSQSQSQKSSILVFLCHAKHLFLHWGQCIQAQAIPLYLNLGSLYHKMKMFGIGSLQKMHQNS